MRIKCIFFLFDTTKNSIVVEITLQKDGYMLYLFVWGEGRNLPENI